MALNSKLDTPPKYSYHLSKKRSKIILMSQDYRYIDLKKSDEGRRIRNMCDVAERLEKKGAVKNSDEIIRRMLRRGDSLEDVAYAVDADIEYIRKIESEMLQPN